MAPPIPATSQTGTTWRSPAAITPAVLDARRPPIRAAPRPLIDRFVAAPGRLRALRTGCAARIPAIQTPGAYPRRLAGAAAASVIAGPARSPAIRRAVTVAAGALADAVMLGGRRGVGLHGGAWSSAGGHLRLHGDRFVTDARVSGVGRHAAGAGTIRGELTVVAGRLRVRVTVGWRASSQRATATVGASRLTLPAP